MSNSSFPSLLSVYAQLTSFAKLENFWSLFNTVFGSNYDYSLAAMFRSQWQDQDFSQLPTIEVIDDEVLGNAWGAYASSTNIIYLSDQFVETASPQALEAVLIEEIGHFVDAQVNTTDTVGDEGELFSDLVRGVSVSGSELARIKTEDDHAVISLGGQLITVEQAALSSTINLAQTFFLNSLPGANHTIYLDFDGHITSGTDWNLAYNSGADIVTPAFDFDGNTASFSNSELERIQAIWQRVAEDYIPFNVNVTTQAPTNINDLIKSGTGDTRWGVRVAIGGSGFDWYTGAAGVAYLNSFGTSDDVPTFVFVKEISNGDEKLTAETISHEVAHSLGLSHDSQDANGNGVIDTFFLSSEEYYRGHGSGETAWAPIMGNGDQKNLTQWNKGEYTGAFNKEDDLQIITTQNGFGYRLDDTGNTIATAKALTLSGNLISGSGIIEQNTDVDFYWFSTIGISALNFAINPAARGPNLDILAELYNSSGVLIASSNPTDFLSANISATVTAGTYYLKIDGVGKGDPLTTGYSDYGSLGQYFIDGTVNTNITPTIFGPTGYRQFGSSGFENVLGLFSSNSGISTDNSGNVYVTGQTNNALLGNSSLGSYDAYVAKYDAHGNQLWIKQFGTSSYDTASGIRTDSSGNYYITGLTLGVLSGNSSLGSYDAYLAKYDASGNQLWAKQFGTSNSDDASVISVENSGAFYVAGNTFGSFLGNNNLGNRDAYLAKYDTSGNQLWVKQFGASGEDYADGLTTDISGNIYVLGRTDLPSSDMLRSRDAYIAKYNTSGNQLWMKQLGTFSGVSANGISGDNTGNIYVVGGTYVDLPGNNHIQRSARQCGTIEKKLRGSNVPFIQRYSRKNC